jgi:UDP-glucose 4-epimerase
MDLASGHVAALNMLQKSHQNYKVYNLGTGQGVSVLQLVKTFERVTGTAIPYKIVERREGDISVMYANAELAERELEWKSKHTLEEMCVDFWRWQTMNPDGYRTKSTKMTNGHR